MFDSSIDLGRMVIQLVLSFLGACAGVRIAEDILHWRRSRFQEAEESAAE